MLALFVLLSTLINQGVGRFYFKLQKMFILSRAMTISYMAYPSFQRKERILRNSPGKLIFKAVGGRGEKENKTPPKPPAHKAPKNSLMTQGPCQPPPAPEPATPLRHWEDFLGAGMATRHLSREKWLLPRLKALSRAEGIRNFP